MTSFDRWFRCKISKKQRAHIELEESGGGARAMPQQIIQGPYLHDVYTGEEEGQLQLVP